MVPVVAHAAGALEQALDRRHVRSLKEVAGGRSHEVEHLLGVAVDGPHAEQHAGLHVDEADGNALGHGLLGIGEG